MVESSNQVRAIGGYFELADKDFEYGNLPVEGTALNTCRNSLEYVILQLTDAKRIFIPYYTCEAIIEPLKRLSVEYEFYHINEKMEIASEIVLGEGDYLIANNYFGIKDAYIAELAKKYEGKLIVDNAQALFAPVFKNIMAIYSTRKYVGVADGGFAVGMSEVYAVDYQEDNSSEHDSHLYIRKDKGAEAGFNDYQVNEHKLDNQPIRRMSYQTKTILSQLDYNSIIDKRRRNYLFLSNVLNGKNILKLPCPESFTCPMVYPFMTDDVSLRGRLIQNKVFVARYWPNVLEWCGKDEIEYKFAVQVIPLPIDQRYGVEDMERIVSLIKL